MRRPTSFVLLLGVLLPIVSLAQAGTPGTEFHPPPQRSTEPPPPPPPPDERESDARPSAPPRAPLDPAEAQPSDTAPSVTSHFKGLVARGERPTTLAHVWLIGGQAAHGASELVFICLIADCEEVTVPLAIGGFLVGGATSWLLTRDGISAGPASTVNAGSIWGVVNGLLLNLARPPNTEQVAGATLLVFTSGMTALGAALAYQFKPTAGQVGMANSGGIWVGVVGGLLMYGLYPADRGGIPRGLFGVELALIDAGILGMALLSTVYEASWERMLIIDAGGMLGTLFGVGLSFVIAQGFDRPTFGVVSALGAAGGLAGAAYLTRNMDLKLPAVPVSFAPMGPLGTPGVTLGGLF